DLRFHLYHQRARLALLFKDYQGEHLELGRRQPIHGFLRDCDAVWLCLDAPSVSTPHKSIRRQQEVEQLIEDNLGQETRTRMSRPMALVLTKADLVSPDTGVLKALAQTQLAMTCHALWAHCEQQDFFAVSSLGCPLHEGKAIQPRNLAEPLDWLASALL